MLSLPLAQIQAHEVGTLPPAFLDIRAWLLALDMPFTQFTQQLDETLDASLTHDQQIQITDDFADAPSDPYGSDDDDNPVSQAPDIYPDIRGEQGSDSESSSD